MSLAFDLNSIQVVRDDDYGFECTISGRSIRNDNREVTGALTFRFVENYRYCNVQFVGNPRADYYSSSFDFPNYYGGGNDYKLKVFNRIKSYC